MKVYMYIIQLFVSHQIMMLKCTLNWVDSYTCTIYTCTSKKSAGLKIAHAIASHIIVDWLYTWICTCIVSEEGFKYYKLNSLVAFT